MTALTENKKLDEKVGKLVAHPVVASDIIYQGALVKVNAAGYLAPCSSEAGAVFAGVAYEQKDNSAGAAGAVSCRVQKEGRFLMTGSGFSQANVGDKVYASDDQTLTLTNAVGLQCVGVIDEYVSATQAWVKIDSAVDKKYESQFAIIAAGEFTTEGGDAAESVTVTGVLASDIVLASLETEGAAPVTLDAAAAASDAINFTMSANPSTDHIISYMVLRAI